MGCKRHQLVCGRLALWGARPIGRDSRGPYPTPFNQPFFIVMNLAVGGNYLGSPSINSINTGSDFPGQMLVDYVRLYNETGALELAAGIDGGKLSLTWRTNIVCHSNPPPTSRRRRIGRAFPAQIRHLRRLRCPPRHFTGWLRRKRNLTGTDKNRLSRRWCVSD